jgi:hypothetical protein
MRHAPALLVFWQRDAALLTFRSPNTAERTKSRLQTAPIELFLGANVAHPATAAA